PSKRTEVLLNVTPFHGGIRVGEWKLVHNGQVGANATSLNGKERFELFHISKDPSEENDLSAADPEKLTELKNRLKEYAKEAVEPNIPPNQMPANFMVPKVW
ncbi:MAG: hypothetical protein KDA84_04440, partial [Planctomycetaceae bacterium]|nr:hypothetical protein [Planctomycetaceae bacterium]